MKAALVGSVRMFPCVLLGLSLLAAPALPAAEKTATPAATTPAPEQRFAVFNADADSLLVQAYPDEAVKLKAGATEFVALDRPAQRGQPRGGVLLIADYGVSPDAGLVGALRRELSNAGWRTLAIGLPAPDPVPQAPRAAVAAPATAENIQDKGEPKATAAAKNPPASTVTIDLATGANAPNPASGQGPTDAQARISAAIAHMQGADASQLAVVAFGHAAEVMLCQALSDDSLRTRQEMGWILIDPRLDKAAGQLDKVFAKGFTAPLLEMVNSTDREAARGRFATAQRLGVAQYRQDFVAHGDLTDVNSADRIGARIKGWLKSHFK